MRVAIVGAGAVAFSVSALLQSSGHEVRLWSTTGSNTSEFEAGNRLHCSGALNGDFALSVASGCVEALAGSDVVIFAIPANGIKAAIDLVVPVLRTGQTVIFSSHLSFAALYLSKLLRARCIELPIVAWGTTIATAKRQSATSVKIGAIRRNVDIATLPVHMSSYGSEVCQKLFGDCFVAQDSIISIALSNLNPQNHLALALLNLTRMELAESWDQMRCVTDSVGRLMESLDLERISIAKAFNLKVKSVRDHFSSSYQLEVAAVSIMSQRRYLGGVSSPGPTSPNSRYVLEDVPFGLVPIILLSELTHTPAPLHQAGILLLSASYGRNFSLENDLLPELELGEFSTESLVRLAKSGFS